MTDDRFDDQLRAFLAGRAPVDVSPVLRARLSTVPVEVSRRGFALGIPVGAPWRAITGLVATGAAVAVAAVLLALLLGTDRFVIRDPSTVGQPPPSAPMAPFLNAPTGFFTAGA